MIYISLVRPLLSFWFFCQCFNPLCLVLWVVPDLGVVAWHDHELEHVKEWSRPYQKGQRRIFHVQQSTVACCCDLCPSNRPFGFEQLGHKHNAVLRL
jgi:hypothetical protein